MKTRISVLIFSAMMAASVLTFGTAPTSKVAIVAGRASGIFKVIYQGTEPGNVTLKVVDEMNNVIFSQTKRGLAKFIQPLNFAGLEQGEYAIEVTDNTGTQIQAVNYTSSQVKSTTEQLKSYHVTKLPEEGKYLISVASQSNGKIRVQIFDGNDNLIHSEHLKVNGNLGLVYNLKSVEGTPRFLVTGH